MSEVSKFERRLMTVKMEVINNHTNKLKEMQSTAMEAAFLAGMLEGINQLIEGLRDNDANTQEQAAAWAMNLQAQIVAKLTGIVSK